jgi:hypothetical protein
MKKIDSIWAMIRLIVVPVLLGSCTWLLMRDFQKGTQILELDIGQVHALTKSLALPEGEADLAFVLPGYDCKEPLSASISVKIRFADGGDVHQDVNLRDITWPASGQGCRPIGYMRLDDSTFTRPLRLVISRENNPVTFSFSVTRAADVSRQMSIWVVYGDRSPVDRMLGAQEGS